MNQNAQNSKYHIKIASWNIQGLRTRLQATNSSLGDTKLNIQSIQRTIKEYDIICLQETWLKDNTLNFPGYTVHFTIQDTTSKRGSRGVALLIKNSLCPFIEKLPNNSSNILWCKLNQHSFGHSKDIYLATVYLPPLQCQTKTGEDVLSTLEQNILKYQEKGDIILLGDLNARTGVLNDFIENDFRDLNIPDDNYITDTTWPKRNNSDTTVNKQGEAIIKLCIGHRLRILNGRTIGDFAGNLTGYQSNGASTVDYSIISNSLRKNILAFSVNNLTPYSDHCLISLRLATPVIIPQGKITQNKSDKTNNKIKKKMIRYSWSEDSNVTFCNALQSPQIQVMLNKQLSQNHNASIDEKLKSLNDIIQTAAKISLKVRPSHKNNTQKKKKIRQKWYTNECKFLKQKLKALARTINHTNYNSKKDEYWRLKKQYKKLVKKTHRQHKNETISKINNYMNKNSSELWNELRNLKNQNNQTDSSTISEEDWLNHFKKLLYTDNNPEHTHPTSTVHRDTSKLDTDITDKEIQNHLNKLKHKKAPGMDGISNEMLKHGRHYLVPIIKQMFNDILTHGQFPKAWNIGLIKPIYKKGDHSLPTNYRGITLTSCLGKLFTSILQTRLLHFLEENKLLNAEQFGFRPNSRTTDNLFILKQLIHKYSLSNEKLYVCFVDYEKAFDTVWHSGLLYKIQNMGITGNFYKVIKSMYSSISSSVLLDQNTISGSFKCNKGIRQGDGLSPVLFSLFMNDIPEYLKIAGCTGVNINNHFFNSLMFADDLMLISSSALDLQHSINVLSKHANDWKLKVNIEKTKIMIFNKQGRVDREPVFKFNNHLIDIVDKQTYLGLTLTTSGRFTYAREALVKKGLKILATIRRMLSNCDFIPVALYCKLFDSLVKPAILYGCEIWGPELLQYKTPFDKSAIEQFHLKFCKIILGLPWYTSNVASRAELGRFPLISEIQCNIYSYYLRLKYNIGNDLLKHAFNYAMSNATDFQKVYSSLVSNTSNHNIPSKHEIKSKRKKMLKSLHDNYQTDWINNINENSNGQHKITGKFVKTKYNFESYLTTIRKPANRIALTKLRLGVHKLRIQTGKYEDKGKAIPVNQRICKICTKNEIENVEHFIGHCTGFTNIRKDYFNQISSIDTSFATLDISNKIFYILKSEKPETSSVIGQYIINMNSERNKQILCK